MRQASYWNKCRVGLGSVFGCQGVALSFCSLDVPLLVMNTVSCETWQTRRNLQGVQIKHFWQNAMRVRETSSCIGQTFNCIKTSEVYICFSFCPAECMSQLLYKGLFISSLALHPSSALSAVFSPWVLTATQHAMRTVMWLKVQKVKGGEWMVCIFLCLKKIISVEGHAVHFHFLCMTSPRLSFLNAGCHWQMWSIIVANYGADKMALESNSFRPQSCVCNNKDLLTRGNTQLWASFT